MDGREDTESTNTPRGTNAGLKWTIHALEIVHNAMKGEPKLQEMPAVTSIPNYNSGDAERQQLLHKMHETLLTLQAKAKSFEEARRESETMLEDERSRSATTRSATRDTTRDTGESPNESKLAQQLQQAMSKVSELENAVKISTSEANEIKHRQEVDEKELRRITHKLDEYSKQEVHLWPHSLEYQESSVSKYALKCIQTMENMYMFAYKEAILRRRLEDQLSRDATTKSTSKANGEPQNESKLAKQLQRAHSKMSELQDAVQKATSEANENKNRLSECLGAKLSDNNPNIADLSDPNRPTKLAEMYSQLYDNEWTDAFSHQTDILRQTERQAIDRLLTILKDANGYCVGQTKAYMDRVLAVMTLSDDAATVYGNSGELSDKKSPLTPESLSPTQRRAFHDLLRQLGEQSGLKIAKKYIVHLTRTQTYTTNEITSCKTYIEKCCELCWYMNLQTPPVYVDFQSKDLKEHRFYTKQGSQIDFVVWPPLKIHADGPLLNKGVAQGRN